MKDIDPAALMKDLSEDAENVFQDANREKDIDEDALPEDENAPEAVASDGQDTGKALEREELKNI